MSTFVEQAVDKNDRSHYSHITRTMLKQQQDETITLHYVYYICVK